MRAIAFPNGVRERGWPRDGSPKVISGKKHTRSKFVVPPSGGITPPEGGTTNCLLVYSFP
ncbi:hypothetical protein QUF80_19850 [Desulfococcaceae bacterium HSG8]|nr:hypothetical protein [Desulfococcaceae bacterium HSG8]